MSIFSEQDNRPKRGGWAPGNYLNTCHKCMKQFIGDKRAFICSCCAYAAPEPATVKESLPVGKSDLRTADAEAFWKSEAAADTINYPWESAEIYSNMKVDAILDAIAARRDYHLRHAQEQLALVAAYAAKDAADSLKYLSDASGAANWHNFAANSLAVLLKQLECTK